MTEIRRVAQLVVHRTPNPKVGGSSPSAPAKVVAMVEGATSESAQLDPRRSRGVFASTVTRTFEVVVDAVSSDPASSAAACPTS